MFHGGISVYVSFYRCFRICLPFMVVFVSMFQDMFAFMVVFLFMLFVIDVSWWYLCLCCLLSMFHGGISVFMFLFIDVSGYVCLHGGISVYVPCYRCFMVVFLCLCLFVSMFQDMFAFMVVFVFMFLVIDVSGYVCLHGGICVYVPYYRCFRICLPSWWYLCLLSVRLWWDSTTCSGISTQTPRR